MSSSAPTVTSAQATKPRQHRVPFDCSAWIASCVFAEQDTGRSPVNRRYRYVTLGPESVDAMDARRNRNERVGEAAWREFEDNKLGSIAKLVRQIVSGLSKESRAACKVYMTGNLACRVALAPLIATPDVSAVVAQAFPASIVNISISVTDPAHIPYIAFAADKAVVALKRHMDEGVDRRDGSVNSCMIVQSPRGAVMIDVPDFGHSGHLAPTMYSVCRNISHPRFLMTRLRRSVPDGAGSVQIPLLDVTIHSEPAPQLCRAPLTADSSVLVQQPEFLSAYFTALACDPEVRASAAKMQRCHAALHGLAAVRDPTVLLRPDEDDEPALAQTEDEPALAQTEYEPALAQTEDEPAQTDAGPAPEETAPVEVALAAVSIVGPVEDIEDEDGVVVSSP